MAGGTCYEAAKAGIAYEAVAKYPENLNLLNGGFQAYFSLDGFSFAFQLPISDLYNSIVKC